VRAVALVAAGALAGVVGTAGGILSLVSYPALLALGLSPLTANVSNLVAAVSCWPGAALGSRPELKGRARWLRRWGPTAAIGAGIGTALLLLTPAGVFARIVPWLVLLGAFSLLLEPQISRWRTRRFPGQVEPHPLALTAWLLAVFVYGGYFGAGSGVMTLTLMLVLVDRYLPIANALKNMLIGAGQIVCAILLTIFGPVDWGAVWPLAIGMLGGSTVGPVVARHAPRTALRYAIVALGIGLAVELWVNPG
jgi:uncharacterized membrane protein YfcA